MIFLYIGIGVFILLLGGVIFSFFYTNKIAKRLYKDQWTRHGDYKFERGCSDTSFAYHLDMFNKGMKIREMNLKFIKELHIVSEGLNLYAEYYDFGFDKAAIILPGRMETAYYGAFYLPPFKESGYNLLCIDPRAHGLSEGEFITLGKHEAIDTINWAKLLHEEYKVNHVLLYGICGGATCACYTLTDPNCPKYIDRLIGDGMFISFYEMYKQHIIDEKKPVFPVLEEVFYQIKKHNDVDPYKAKPIRMIKDIKVPTLIISGELDKFALPKNALKLYEASGSIKKSLVYIKNARHSHVRYDNEKEYDDAIMTFLKDTN